MYRSCPVAGNQDGQRYVTQRAFVSLGFFEQLLKLIVLERVDRFRHKRIEMEPSPGVQLLQAGSQPVLGLVDPFRLASRAGGDSELEMELQTVAGAHPIRTAHTRHYSGGIGSSGL
jgi:hypothetical protein